MRAGSAARDGRALALALVAALAGSGCQFGGAKDAQTREIPTALAQGGAFRVTIEEVGVLRSTRARELKAPRWGKVAKVVPSGTPVQEGDPVLWLDVNDVEQALRRLEAELAESESEMDKQLERLAFQEKSGRLDLDVSLARLEFERRKLELAGKAHEDALRRRGLGLISQAAVDDVAQRLRGAELSADQSRLAHERKLAEMDAERRGIEVQRQRAAQQREKIAERRERMQRDLDASVLKAPSAGEVFLPKLRMRGDAERAVRSGDQVGPWMGALVQVPDRSQLEVRSQVDESLISRVVPGLPVEIRAPAVEGLVLAGAVQSTAVLAVARSKSEGAGFSDDKKAAVEKIVFPVTISVQGSDPRLQPGMTVSVSYVLSTVPGAVSVPDDAIFGSATAPRVFVGDARRWDEREVTLGPSSGGRVVIASGLDAGEQVLLGDPRPEGRS